MKKILYITSFLPYDTPFAGSKVSYNILKNITKDYEVDLLSFCTEVENKYEVDFIDFCLEEKNINLLNIIRVSKYSRILNSILFLFLPSLLVARFSFKYLFKIKKDYNFIYVDWSQSVFFGYLLSKILKKPVIFTLHDILTQSLERKFIAEKNYFKKGVFFFEYFKLKMFEKFFIKQSKINIVLSNKDKLILINNMKINDNKILVITPYFNKEMNFFDKSQFQNSFNILFWGAMNRVENTDAVEYYLKTFHNKLKSKIKNYKFIVAGVNPPKEMIEKYKHDKTIFITGFLDDPSEIFNISHISVIPLRLGAGIKIKTLESLYMGLPTISTIVGAEGIDVNQENGLFIEKNDIEFLNRIINIYKNYKLVDKQLIHDNILINFNFDESLKKIDDFLSKI